MQRYDLFFNYKHFFNFFLQKTLVGHSSGLPLSDVEGGYLSEMLTWRTTFPKGRNTEMVH
ncbi:hypothetical protein AXF12_11245 [Capnocytophaga haemolytica]|uniref:Uncharacterized protein n=1 Tax=Capnocytophaga haemolytica TaxID=45243 RepID=A0ABM5XFN0_9FLAO|nr:hypothetical protein AXF12_11245 [Capnocytophaga haemolytica]